VVSFADYQLHPAEELGLVQERLEEILVRARNGVEQGPLPSAQLALARRGKLALFATVGDAGTTPRYNTFSCTKAIIAAAVWLLMSRGKLDVNTSVCQIIPEFSGSGKEAITVEQLLCHTAGIPHAPMGPPDWFTREGRLSKMHSWRLNWEPGSRMEYHTSSAHWVIAEIIERLAGRDYREFIADEIIGPLGLAGFQLGVPLDQQGDIEPLLAVGEVPTPEEVVQLLGVAMEWPELPRDHLLRFNEAETRALGVPGGGAVSDAASLALFYQALLHNPGKLWNPQVLADGVGTIRTTLADPTTGAPANRSLGIVIAGDDEQRGRRGMGRTNSSRSFGHSGAGGQVAWADPDSGISFCLLTNGLDANPIRAARFGVSLSNRAGLCHQPLSQLPASCL